MNLAAIRRHRPTLMLALAGPLAVAAASGPLGVPSSLDGFAPTQPYNWLSAPAGAVNGGPPDGAGTVLQLPLNQAAQLLTPDQQAQVTVNAASFGPAITGPVRLTVNPVSAPGGIELQGNAYDVEAAPAAAGSPAPALSTPISVRLRFVPLPSVPDSMYHLVRGSWVAVKSEVQPQSQHVVVLTTDFGVYAPGSRTGAAKGGTVPAWALPAGIAALLALAGGALLVAARGRGGAGD
ncbi:MAG: hypothetical protein ACYDAY_02195 [Candidatus Dormibacteria bacterium]